MRLAPQLRRPLGLASLSSPSLLLPGSAASHTPLCLATCIARLRRDGVAGRRYASVKAQGAYKLRSNKTIMKKMGAKKTGDQYVIPGNIIFKQRGTIHHPGENTIMGRDHTIHAAVAGYVKYYRDLTRHPTRSYIGVAFNREDKLPYPPNAPRRRKLGMYAVPRKPDPPPSELVSPSGIPLWVTRQEELPISVANALKKEEMRKGKALEKKAEAVTQGQAKTTKCDQEGKAKSKDTRNQATAVNDKTISAATKAKEETASRAQTAAIPQAGDPRSSNLVPRMKKKAKAKDSVWGSPALKIARSRTRRIQEATIRRRTRILRLQSDYSYRETNWEIGRLVGPIGRTAGTMQMVSRKKHYKIRRRQMRHKFLDLKAIRLEREQERAQKAAEKRELKAKRREEQARALAKSKSARRAMRKADVDEGGAVDAAGDADAAPREVDLEKYARQDFWGRRSAEEEVVSPRSAISATPAKSDTAQTTKTTTVPAEAAKFEEEAPKLAESSISPTQEPAKQVQAQSPPGEAQESKQPPLNAQQESQTAAKPPEVKVKSTQTAQVTKPQEAKLPQEAEKMKAESTQTTQDTKSPEDKLVQTTGSKIEKPTVRPASQVKSADVLPSKTPEAPLNMPDRVAPPKMTQEPRTDSPEPVKVGKPRTDREVSSTNGKPAQEAVKTKANETKTTRATEANEPPTEAERVLNPGKEVEASVKESGGRPKIQNVEGAALAAETKQTAIKTPSPPARTETVARALSIESETASKAEARESGKEGDVGAFSIAQKTSEKEE